jgi:hypothetical protein
MADDVAGAILRMHDFIVQSKWAFHNSPSLLQVECIGTGAKTAYGEDAVWTETAGMILI